MKKAGIRRCTCRLRQLPFALVAPRLPSVKASLSPAMSKAMPGHFSRRASATRSRGCRSQRRGLLYPAHTCRLAPVAKPSHTSNGRSRLWRAQQIKAAGLFAAAQKVFVALARKALGGQDGLQVAQLTSQHLNAFCTSSPRGNCRYYQRTGTNRRYRLRQVCQSRWPCAAMPYVIEVWMAFRRSAGLAPDR